MHIMKTRLFQIVLLLLAATTATATPTYDFEVDGIYYSIDGTNVAVTSKTEDYGGYRITDTGAYRGDITIPDTVTYDGVDYPVTSIGSSAFGSCKSLTSVTMGSNITYIGPNAFNSSGITSIFISSTVSSFGNDVFANCSALTSMTVDPRNRYFDSRDNCKAIIRTATNTLLFGCQNTVIPNTVTKIDNYAFSGCSTLTNIHIPVSVKTIGYAAFEGCSGLETMTVDPGNPKYDSRDNCNAIIESATNTLINGCQNSFIPNTVTAIRDYAFEDCKSLKSIVIPNSVTKIGVSAFYGCSGLTDLTISNSVNTLNWGVFYGCSSLKSVVIPSSVTRIYESAFMHCTSLETLTIPKSVRSIGERAFLYCKLTDVYCFISDLSRVTVKSEAFSNNTGYSGRTLHVPYGTAQAYLADSNWSEYFANIVEMDCGDIDCDGVVGIGDVSLLIDMILEGTFDATCDFNGDGSMNITDLNVLINLINASHQ